MQIDKELENVLRGRKGILIKICLSLFMIAAAYMITYHPYSDEELQPYDVDVAVGVMLAGGTINGQPTTTPTIHILVKGGKGVINLKTLTITINNQTVSEMNPPGKATLRWKHASEHFPVQDANGNHVVATGHFSDGMDIILVDVTV